MLYRIHCPYCLSVITDDTVDCPVCGKDTREDAKVEMTVQEYEEGPRKPCRFCGAPMVKLAVVCTACRERQ